MKSLLIGVFLIVFFVTATNAQFPAGFGWVFPRESPPANVTQTVGVTDITIKYHRPSAKGRRIWGCQTIDIVPKPGAPYGCLVPNGQVWGAGANDATTITFNTPVIINPIMISTGPINISPLL